MKTACHVMGVLAATVTASCSRPAPQRAATSPAAREAPAETAPAATGAPLDADLGKAAVELKAADATAGHEVAQEALLAQLAKKLDGQRIDVSAALEQTSKKMSAKNAHLLLAQGAVRRAIATFETRTPASAGYEARKQVVQLFRQQYPEARRFVLRPEPRIRLSAGASEVVPPGPQYSRLRVLDGFGFEKEYQSLMDLTGAQIPDDALVPLCLLSLKDAKHLDYDGYPTPAELLRRAGPRVRPALLHIMAYPEQYGFDDALPRNVYGDAFEPIVASLLAHTAGWVEDDRKELARLALEAGWTRSVRARMPDVAAELADSPYVAP